MKIQIATGGLIAVVLCAGCANDAGSRMGLFSATAPVIAILNDDLFVGTAEGYANRTGKIEITSKVNPDVRCIGNFRYLNSGGGDGSMQCNDGHVADFNFTALSMLSGYGIGKSTKGATSFTYGLTIDDAQKYLLLPKGKRVTPDEKKQPKLSDV